VVIIKASVAEKAEMTYLIPWQLKL